MRQDVIKEGLTALVEQVRREVDGQIAKRMTVAYDNHRKVLQAFAQNRVSEIHFHGTTGYGLGDVGRDTLDDLFATVFGAEAGLVRIQFVSGTHTLATCLMATLGSGDELVSLCGTPYDSLLPVIGVGEHETAGSLTDRGVIYREVELKDGRPNEAAIKAALSPRTKVALIQRSRGYAWRQSLTIKEIKRLIDVVKGTTPQAICLVDNCYGEFVEDLEPPEAGADLTAGSLIKNPGGGIAPAGGYVVGKSRYVEMVSRQLTAPGIGGHLGATLGINRYIFHGLYLAPRMVEEALAGAVFAARLLERLGIEVLPGWEDERSDIVQAVKMETPEALLAFCKAIQKASPIDSFLLPQAAPLPGYRDEVIMAGGTFIQGSTLELSVDAPMRPPYIAYLQGGLSREYMQLGLIRAVRELYGKGFLPR